MTPKKAALIYGEDLHDIALEGAERWMARPV